MRILVQFPTLARPKKFLDCLKKYVDMASGKHRVMFNINCDVGDQTMNNHKVVDEIHAIFMNCGNLNLGGMVNFDLNTTKIGAINSHIDPDTFDVLLVASDDMIPQVEGWDHEIATEMEKNFPNFDGALHFNDSYTENKLITLSIMGVRLYNEFGYVYHPDYKSLYCDDEFTQAVKNLGKYVYIPRCIIRHEHYSNQGNSNTGDRDYAAEKTLRFAGRDGLVFQERQKRGFPKNRITND